MFVLNWMQMAVYDMQITTVSRDWIEECLNQRCTDLNNFISREAYLFSAIASFCAELTTQSF